MLPERAIVAALKGLPLVTWKEEVVLMHRYNSELDILRYSTLEIISHQAQQPWKEPNAQPVGACS